MHDELLELLRWTGKSTLARDLESTLIDCVSSRLGGAIRDIGRSDPRRSEMLEARIRELPDASFMRILTAPQAYYLVSYRAGVEDGKTAQILSDALDAEACRSGNPPELSHPVWSILGDCYFPTGYREQDWAEAQDSLTWQPDRTYRAPRLPIGMPVDSCSPYARGELPDISGGDAGFTPEEVGISVKKLGATVESMRTVSLAALEFVARFSRVLVIRRDTESNHVFHASSTRMCIGRPVFRNPNLPGVRPSDLAESLIHESIHGIIDTMELRTSLLWTKDFQAPQIPSPWTGRVLDTNTYIQACFIWYGLWNFWLGAINSNAFPFQEVFSQMQRSSRGFAAKDVVAPLADRGVREGVLEVLRRAQADVLSSLHLVKQALGSVVDAM
jgi:hypothetical protein